MVITEHNELDRYHFILRHQPLAKAEFDALIETKGAGRETKKALRTLQYMQATLEVTWELHREAY